MSQQICAGKGITCDELPESLYCVITGWIRLPLALFVLYISMTKLHDEIVKWYTVFLYAFLTPYFFIYAIFVSVDTYNLYYSELQFLLEGDDTILIIICRFMNGLSHFQFRALSLYMTIVFLLSYKSPVKFRKYAARWIKLRFGVISIGVLIVDAPSLYSMANNSYIDDRMSPEYAKVIATTGVWIDIIVNIIIGTISVVLVILAMFAIMRYKVKPNSLRSSGKCRTECIYQLIQFMLFFAPLTVVQLSAFLLNWSFVLRQIFPSLTTVLREHYGAVLLNISAWTQDVLLTMMPLCTLIALSPYRKAVRELLHFERRA